MTPPENLPAPPSSLEAETEKVASEIYTLLQLDRETELVDGKTQKTLLQEMIVHRTLLCLPSDKMPPNLRDKVNKVLKEQVDPLEKDMYKIFDGTMPKTEENKDAMKKRWQECLKAVIEVNEDVRKEGRKMLKSYLELPEELSAQDFAQFVTDMLRTPIPSPPPSSGDTVKTRHQEMEKERRAFLEEFMNAELNGCVAGIDKDTFQRSMYTFLTGRHLYETFILHPPTKESPSAFWMTIFALAPGEVFEEWMEEYGEKFAERTASAAERLTKGSIAFLRAMRGAPQPQSGITRPVIKRAPFLERMGIVSRKSFAKACVDVESMLIRNGIQPRDVQRMLTKGMNFFAKAGKPGIQFFKTFANPVTALLFGIYIENSTNRAHAIQQFATFIAISMGTNGVVKLCESLVAQGATGLTGARLAKFQSMITSLKNGKSLAMMRVGSRFIITMIVMIVFQKEIEEGLQMLDEWKPDDYTTDKILDAIDSVFSHGAGVDLWGYNPLSVRDWGDRARDFGVITIDPSAAFTEEMTRTYPKWVEGESWWDGRSMEYKLTLEQWVQRVTKAISSQPNTILQACWEVDLEYARNPERLSNLKSVELWQMAGDMYRLEDELAEHLIDQKIVSDRSQLHGVEIATREFAQGHQGMYRNDRYFGYAKDATETAGEQKIDASDRFGVIDAYFKNCGDATLQKLWKNYTNHGLALSTQVGLYRHLGLYKKDEWIGKLEDFSVKKEEESKEGAQKPEKRIVLPPGVERGMMERIVYEFKKDQAFLVKEKHDKAARLELATALADPALLSRDSPEGKAEHSPFLQSCFRAIDFWKGSPNYDRYRGFVNSLLIATRGAVLYTPEDHRQINHAFARLRDRAKDEASFAKSIGTREFFELYNSITDTMCKYHAQKSMTTKGLCESYAEKTLNLVTDTAKKKEFTEKFTAQFGLSPDNMFFAIDCDPYLMAQNRDLLLARTFPILKAKRPTIAICQLTQPTYTKETFGYLSAIRLHCFHWNPVTRGWSVAVYNKDQYMPYTPRPQNKKILDFLREQLGRPSTWMPITIIGSVLGRATESQRRKGEREGTVLSNVRDGADILTLTQWVRVYPGFAKAVEPRLKAHIQQTEQEERQEQSGQGSPDPADPSNPDE